MIEKKENEWKRERERITKMWEDRLQAAKKVMNEEKMSLYDEIQGLKTEGYKPTKR